MGRGLSQNVSENEMYVEEASGEDVRKDCLSCEIEGWRSIVSSGK
jgi:hypothetical protein